MKYNKLALKRYISDIINISLKKYKQGYLTESEISDQIYNDLKCFIERD
jgi:hypothetical protein